MRGCFRGLELALMGCWNIEDEARGSLQAQINFCCPLVAQSDTSRYDKVSRSDDKPPVLIEIDIFVVSKNLQIVKRKKWNHLESIIWGGAKRCLVVDAGGSLVASIDCWLLLSVNFHVVLCDRKMCCACCCGRSGVIYVLGDHRQRHRTV
mmetsp:Transcript_40220/g.68606  ORF Transcript_40220/g.68606 Transcript_40220/m.68606 type:complete len:150 (-) Transcript_40220:32-481(-)